MDNLISADLSLLRFGAAVLSDKMSIKLNPVTVWRVAVMMMSSVVCFKGLTAKATFLRTVTTGVLFAIGISLARFSRELKILQKRKDEELEVMKFL